MSVRHHTSFQAAHTHIHLTPDQIFAWAFALSYGSFTYVYGVGSTAAASPSYRREAHKKKSQSKAHHHQIRPSKRKLGCVYISEVKTCFLRCAPFLAHLVCNADEKGVRITVNTNRNRFPRQRRLRTMLCDFLACLSCVNAPYRIHACVSNMGMTIIYIICVMFRNHLVRAMASRLLCPWPCDWWTILRSSIIYMYRFCVKYNAPISRSDFLRHTLANGSCLIE